MVEGYSIFATKLPKTYGGLYKISNDLIKTIATLTEHPDLIASMRKKMKNISKTYSNESIVLLSEKMIKEKNKKKREHLSITG